MDVTEVLLVVIPALGLAIAVGLMRSRRTYSALALGAACVITAAAAAVLGNARPIAGLFAWALLLAAFIADEGESRGLAISCFAAAFVVLIVTVMYT
jgi:hypothetical protein